MISYVAGSGLKTHRPVPGTLALAFYDDSGLYESSIVDHVQRHAQCKTRADWLALLSAPEEQPSPANHRDPPGPKGPPDDV